ncbi:putative T7SS-secreted protein [Leifsonia sp. NPDC080035]|uniref:T7SS-secreted protein n=1 Tax=Leifsonia sp. NPDC080035 TaxID=3143936 RepID=A0AAU7GFY0_9MICO
MSDKEFQPLTGDPDLLETKAKHYQAIGEAIQRASKELNKIHDVDGYKSQAVDKLKEMSKDTADDISKAKDRYAKTASALIAYAASLREAKDDADKAIALINSKQADADAAKTAAKTAHTDAQNAKPDDASTAKKSADDADDAARDANAALQAAHQAWYDAKDKKDGAARKAVDAIVDVVDHHNNGLKNPGFWDKVMDVISTIGDIAGVLAIFFSWVPILGQVLVVIALVASVIKLVDAVVKYAKGEGSILGIVGAAVGVALSLFGGRIFAFLGKAARVKSLARVPKLAAGAQRTSQDALKLRIADRLMTSARSKLFQKPLDDVNPVKIWQAAGESAAGQREAYRALVTDGADKMKAMRTLLGIDKNMTSAVIHDARDLQWRNPLTAVVAYHQGSALYNKAAGLANVPNSIDTLVNKFSGGPAHSDAPKLPSVDLTKFAVDHADRYTPTYKSNNVWGG